MIRYEDQCVGCPPERGCLGNSCPYKSVSVYVCDECGDEDVELYEFDDGSQLCKSCLLSKFKIINRRW